MFGGALLQVIFVILCLVALYYLYKFLFSSDGLEGKSVLNTIIKANEKPLTTLSSKFPAMYEGGDYSINTWIYVNDYGVNMGKNKHILSLGGDSFLTLLIYLGRYKNTLHVRVKSSDDDNSLNSGNINGIFNSVAANSDLIDITQPCDIQSVDLQKWVQITISLNTKICDVYIDGKLARSCILPSFYKVDKSNLKMTLVDQGGFGGFVSNTTAYNYALNPEQVWRMYMAGPGSQYTFWGYIKAMFDPNAANSLSYPKMNIVG